MKDCDKETTKQKGKYVKRYFRGMIKSWAMDLRGREDGVKRLAAGKHANKTHKQCKDYIRPFFKQCKSQQVPPDILQATRRIVCLCEQREYLQANDLYVACACVCVCVCAFVFGGWGGAAGVPEETGGEPLFGCVKYIRRT
jgi:hypothetical protein